jgi:hypothetical protein
MHPPHTKNPNILPFRPRTREMTDREQLMALISPRFQNRAKFEEHIMPANALWKRSGSLFWDRLPLAPDQSGFSVSSPSYGIYKIVRLPKERFLEDFDNRSVLWAPFCRIGACRGPGWDLCHCDDRKVMPELCQFARSDPDNTFVCKYSWSFRPYRASQTPKRSPF